VVIATPEPLTSRLAGPGIRALAIAEALAVHHDVQLVTTETAGRTGAGFSVRSVDERGLRAAEKWCDVLIVQGWMLSGRPFLVGSDKVLVCDLYDPLHLEALEQGRDLDPAARADSVAASTDVLNEQLRRGDYFLCASNRQRDFWLGHLASLGRVNPLTYDEDPTLRALIGVVPFGVPATPPARRVPTMRGVVPGIGADDRVVLWGGGIYNWLDPLTVIAAVDRLRADHPDLRLYFLGLRHPSPDVPAMRVAVEARELSDRLGLTGSHVFFNEGWVDYESRQDYLLEADIGVSAHIDHLEASLSFRARILDYLWAGLPVVTTRGDVLADLIERRGLGTTVAAGDVEAMAVALGSLLGDAELHRRCRDNIAAVVPELTWPQALIPLLEFCQAPRRAPDLLAGTGAVGTHWKGWRHDVSSGLEYLRRGGPRLVAEKALVRARRLARRSLG
jgi:glycosyltransferase involved in cell wall biosynthesis